MYHNKLDNDMLGTKPEVIAYMRNQMIDGTIRRLNFEMRNALIVVCLYFSRLINHPLIIIKSGMLKAMSNSVPPQRLV
jgi:hypothetical protein